MSRLLPHSWFSRTNPTRRRYAEQVDALQSYWRAWLASGISRVAGDGCVDASSVVSSLQGLGLAQLLDLDRALRIGWWDTGGGSEGACPTNLMLIRERQPEDDAFLFLASAHPNGFIREQAILTFGHFPGRLAMAAALIRCDDWVPDVRAAASGALVRLIGESSGEEVMAFLPLMLMLRRRRRFAGEIWPSVIEPKLSEPGCEGARWNATRARSAEVRRFAYELVLRSDPKRAGATLLRAVADDHPGIALWAIEQAGKSREDEVRCGVLELAMRHCRGPVRAQAVRRRWESKPDERELLLQCALFDPARAPRNAAAYLMRTELQRSALPIWRAALDERRSSTADVALAALAEHAEGSDYLRLAAHLGHPKPRLRAAALRGVAKAGAPDLRALVIAALSDPAACVVQQAARLMAYAGEPMDRSSLDVAYCRASDFPQRRACIRITRLLSKWDGLEVLLTWATDADAETFAVVEREIERWLRFQNRRFTPLADERRTALIEQLCAVRAGKHGRAWEGLDGVLRPS